MPSRALTLIGTTVAHSLWIGALIAACTAAAMRVLRQDSPVARYWLAMAALAIAAGLPLMVLRGDPVWPNWTPWLGVAWLAGCGAHGIRLVNSLRLVHQLRRSARPAPGPWQSSLDDTASAMGVRRFVALKESDCLEVPSSIGVQRPVILMPAGMLDRLTPPDFRAIAAHELAHVARADYFWNLVQVALEAALFFHPITGWLSRSIQRERELCSDAVASSICEPVALARALAALEYQRRPWHAPAEASGDRPLLDRVRALVAPSRGSRTRAAAANVAAAILLVAGGGVVFAILWATVATGAPAPSPWAPWLMAAALGLAVGVRHAFEPDHLLAVATLVTRERDGRAAARLGASWGIGHTTALLGLGTLLIVARQSLPAQLAASFEAAVAVMIVVMGVRAIRDGMRLGTQGPSVSHRHGATVHAHQASDDHVHIGPMSIARRPLIVGVVHGLSGTGALTALAVTSLPTVSAQVGFLLVFGLGSTLGMAAVAGIGGGHIARLVRTPIAMATLSVTTGVAAVVFGVFWAYPLLVK